VLTETGAVQINQAAALKRKGLEMQSTMMTLVRRPACVSKTFSSMICATVFGLADIAMTVSPVSAFVGGTDSSLQRQLRENSPAVQAYVRRGARPVAGYCWYYTDPSRMHGFWDACP
jgi:hypothetical protein